jgi:hypothetical protein
MACVVRGKVRQIGTVDLSKTSSVENLYTEILLDVEEVTPLERKSVVTPEVVFFRQGKLPIETGDRVELEVDTLDWTKRLRIVRHTRL